MNAQQRAERRRTVLNDYYHSGLSQSEFCRSRGVSVSTLQYWLRRERSAAQQAREEEPGVIEVTARATAQTTGGRTLRVHVGERVTLELELPVDEAELARILKAVAATV